MSLCECHSTVAITYDCGVVISRRATVRATAVGCGEAILEFSRVKAIA